jgi:hypothetical protein
MQVFNMLRSKLTYEAKLLESRGATQSWHERAQPFHDGTVGIERLAAFAQEQLGTRITKTQAATSRMARYRYPHTMASLN